nr:hypothetical protein Q903MT_gene107 [Picea sitchensis]
MYATITIDIAFFTSSDRIGGASPKTMSLGCRGLPSTYFMARCPSFLHRSYSIRSSSGLASFIK